MSTPSAEPEAPAPAPDEPVARRPSMVEAVLDNLPAWTVVAAAITLLYIVWATLDVLNVYSGDIPKVFP